MNDEYQESWARIGSKLGELGHDITEQCGVMDNDTCCITSS